MTYRVKEWSAIYENNRSRELKRLDWVPVPNRMDGDGYTELMDHKDGASHLGAWLAIVQIASKCDVRGTLLREGGKPHTMTTISRISRVSLKVLSEAIPRFIEIGWLEVIDPEISNMQDGAEIPQDDATIPHPPDASRVRAGASVPFPSVPFRSPEKWFEDEFWPLWPVKDNKLPAKAAAKKLDPADYPAILAGVQLQAHRIRSMERPIHAATWLNARRWEDEAPPPLKQQQPRLGFVEGVEAELQRRIIDGRIA